jgi:hypothetical protein
LSLGPGRQSWARYSSTAMAVVTQLRPNYTAQISPRLASRRRCPADRRLSSAASVREISSSRLGLSQLLSLLLVAIGQLCRPSFVSAQLIESAQMTILYFEEQFYWDWRLVTSGRTAPSFGKRSSLHNRLTSFPSLLARQRANQTEF